MRARGDTSGDADETGGDGGMKMEECKKRRTTKKRKRIRTRRRRQPTTEMIRMTTLNFFLL